MMVMKARHTVQYVPFWKFHVFTALCINDAISDGKKKKQALLEVPLEDFFAQIADGYMCGGKETLT